ncbi:MAG TPA: thiamine pyrophosphate-dependent dehydrogenase E1 component subunit alpha [Steroidobacter sp.]|uniref:thiamine pyrophosphate-dependent dehydrogenase E1 component subunit alpha n=1 Tax=Steroidobacter sp. TaxID=1978227 RepID=UPI002EDB72B3
MAASAKVRLWMYQKMVTARLFEERLKLAYLEGKQPVFNMAKGPLPGEMHLASGQEPCAVGVCAHLRADDCVTAPHRAHHVAIAKNVDLRRMAAEIFGKATGLSGGRGGHMHLFDAAVNFSNSGIIAAGMGPAVGMALAAKLQGRDSIAISYIGEGAANQGAFHESLNLAAVWKAPVVFVIEDNAWGISVEKRESTAVERNSIRAQGYDMPGIFVPGNDADAVYEVAGAAIERARAGEGPTLIEIETHRLEGHFMGDAEKYRPPGEVARLQAIDPIPAYRQRLSASGVSAAELDAAETSARELVDDAIASARAAPTPIPADALTCVFI